MSTETKPMRLMPFTKRLGSSGRLVIEPGANEAFELPDEYRPFFEMLERGATLAALAEISPSGTGRFRFLRKFLLFLDDHDLLADRDYARLADSLKSDHTWPVSIISTPVLEFKIAKASKALASRIRRVLVSGGLLILTLGIAVLTCLFVADSNVILPVSDDAAPSLIRSLLIFLFSYSFARSFRSIWVWILGLSEGSRPRLDLVIEPLSIRFREEHAGRSILTLANLTSSGLSLIFCYTAALYLGFEVLHSRQVFDETTLMVAAAFAFFSECSPYSRSAATDLLRSFYARLAAIPAVSGRRESLMRRVHVSMCIAWVLFLGAFIALDLTTYFRSLWDLTRTNIGNEKTAGFVLITIIGCFLASWLADVLSAFSYTEATTGQIRNLWRRRSESPLAKLEGLIPNAHDLEQLPFLRQIPSEARKTLLMSAQLRAFKEGEAICRQGDRDRNLFIVLEGKLAVAASHAVSGGRSRRKIVAWLDPGAVFGENAFFFGQPRTADVIGMEVGRVLVLPHSSTMKLVDAEKSDQLRTRIWFLQALMQSEFFKSLPSESLDSILHAGTEQRFSAGSKVMQEGEKADACYFIVQGRASVAQNMVSIGKLGAGDAFGEIAILMPGSLRTATVSADTDLLTIKIEQDRFWKLLRSHLPLAIEIERLSVRRLQSDRARA